MKYVCIDNCINDCDIIASISQETDAILQPAEFDSGFFLATFGSWLVAYGQRLDLPHEFFETLDLSRVHSAEAERQGTGLQRLQHLVGTLVNDPKQFVAAQQANRAYTKGVPGNPNWDRSLFTHTESNRTLMIPSSEPSEKLILVGNEMRELPLDTKQDISITYEDHVCAQIDAILGKPGDFSRTLGAAAAMEIDTRDRGTLAKLLNLQLENYMIAHSITDAYGNERMTAGIQVAFSPTAMKVDGMVFFNNRWIRFRQAVYHSGRGNLAAPLIEQMRTHESNDPILTVWNNMIGLFDIAFDQVPEMGRRR